MLCFEPEVSCTGSFPIGELGLGFHASGIVSEGYGAFQRQGLAGGDRSQGWAFLSASCWSPR